MRLVTQKHENDCGAACVAIIAGVSLNEAKGRLPAHCEIRGTSSQELRTALLTFGVDTDELKRIGSADYTSFAFDAVLRGKLDDDDHWVVWEAKRKRVLDPYKPGGEFRCTSYVKVNR
ncbi:cysteine peptidase family C39 domain-containing protein [Lichenibacterium dinghuense]|uniref:cysteine peptidase family C39 domain-containing protein n=1 Tax=Lichenibacterium dinghuense TaxID=2895977 RepID=UPI001F01E83C|nr:cysteine peptidase family C39 domain-containing protein [Lichenibacterium sp. 6Y81]